MDSLRKSPPPKHTPSPAQDLSVFPDPLPSEILTRSHATPEPKLPPFRSSARKKYWRAMFFGTISLLCLLICAILVFYFSKSLLVGRAIQFHNETPVSLLTDMKRLAISYLTNDHTFLSGEKNGRVNILLLGRAGEHYPGKNLTDTVMVLSIETTRKKVALLSLPRDLYAPIPDTTLFTKINSLYQYGLNENTGVEPLKKSVEQITGQPIHYFFILDFDGFEKAVDALGGISVDVLRDFYDPRYPGKNYSYETFAIQKGWQTLDGATALKYVRERHNDPEGDFGRAKRQQQVIKAIKDKAFSVGTFLHIFSVNSLLNTLGESVKTDMPLNDIERFLSLTKTLDTENITSVVIDAWKPESLLRVSHIQVGSLSAFILVPRVGNWSEINDISENIFNADALDARRQHITNEQPTLTLLHTPKDALIAEKIRRFIQEELHFSAVSIASPKTLENQPKKSIIIDRTNLSKPYSLDELLKKFTLEQQNAVPFITTDQDTADFTLVLGNDLIEAFAFDETLTQADIEDTSFPELLPPQSRPNKNKP